MAAPTDGRGAATGRAAKRRAILDGALEVFARDGYARASIDAIAEASDVSTRTIYNHFGDKAGLFEAVVEDSATSVSTAHIEQVDSILGGVASAAEMRQALTACGLALQTVVPPQEPHWGLVRHVLADAEHIPADVLDIWRRVGPARTTRQLALYLADFARRGMLVLDDPAIAAVHYSALTGSATGSALEPEVNAERAGELMGAAVAAFLDGYATHP